MNRMHENITRIYKNIMMDIALCLGIPDNKWHLQVVIVPKSCAYRVYVTQWGSI
jgi:hypothetical protein